MVGIGGIGAPDLVTLSAIRVVVPRLQLALVHHCRRQVVPVLRLIDSLRVRIGGVREHIDRHGKVDSPLDFVGEGSLRSGFGLVFKALKPMSHVKTTIWPNTYLQLHAQNCRQFLDLHLLGRFLWRPATSTAVVCVCH